MINMILLFIHFLLAPSGRIRVAKWRALRRECLKRAQVGRKGKVE